MELYESYFSQVNGDIQNYTVIVAQQGMGNNIYTLPSGLERGIQVLWLSHRSLGSNPGHTTCFLEQDALLYNCFSLSRGMRGEPARVEVDSVFEKATGAQWL